MSTGARTGKIEIGPSGRTVAANLKRLRGARQLSLRALSAEVTKRGRPLSVDALNKIEKAAEGTDTSVRRVDVDDLVALAVTLGVTPDALLLPEVADETPVGITAYGTVPAVRAWKWADGAQPLDDEEDPAEFHLRVRPRGRRFLAEVFKTSQGSYVDPATGKKMTLWTEGEDA